MPYQANEARRHKFPKANYQVKNWHEYDQALQERGSFTVWVTPEAIAAWHPLPTGKPGRTRRYSDLAIETGHLLRLALVHKCSRKPSRASDRIEIDLRLSH